MKLDILKFVCDICCKPSIQNSQDSWYEVSESSVEAGFEEFLITNRKAIKGQ